MEAQKEKQVVGYDYFASRHLRALPEGRQAAQDRLRGSRGVGGQATDQGRSRSTGRTFRRQQHGRIGRLRKARSSPAHGQADQLPPNRVCANTLVRTSTPAASTLSMDKSYIELFPAVPLRSVPCPAYGL